MITRSIHFYNWTLYATISPAMNENKLLLASQSPRRRELLALLGLPFDVTATDTRETPHPGETPSELVVRLSRAKAKAAASACIDLSTAKMIITCDTIVAFEGQILGKPSDPKDAKAMLRRLRGRSHTVYSAITLREALSARILTDLAETKVRMRDYTDGEIAAYVASGDPLDKAGAYAIQHNGFHPVAQLQGCYANVVGLPLCHLTRCLRSWKIEPFPGAADAADVPSACQAYTHHPCRFHHHVLAFPPKSLG